MDQAQLNWITNFIWGRSDSSDKESPACPSCGKPMRRRTARKDPNAGQDFWGCSGYPDCREIAECGSCPSASDKPDMAVGDGDFRLRRMDPEPENA